LGFGLGVQKCQVHTFQGFQLKGAWSIAEQRGPLVDVLPTQGVRAELAVTAAPVQFAEPCPYDKAVQGHGVLVVFIRGIGEAEFFRGLAGLAADLFYVLALRRAAAVASSGFGGGFAQRVR
jgi:hypothetical protein